MAKIEFTESKDKMAFYWFLIPNLDYLQLNYDRHFCSSRDASNSVQLMHIQLLVILMHDHKQVEDTLHKIDIRKMMSQHNNWKQY